MGMYQGVNASEGIGIGTVMVAVDPDLTFEPHEVADSAAEKERYQTALSVFCEKTQAQADHMKETVGEAEAEIMSGHIVLAQDPGMTDAINAAIDGGTCAEQALMDTSTMFENMFLSMDDEMFRLRAADIADIRTGILAELLGKEVVDLSVLPENTVVVVHDLTPSMTATIDKAHVAGIVTETGGRTSHSAIIARALEIPAVLSVSNSCTALRNGMTVVVDGGKGIVEADPDEETLAAYTAKAEAFAAEKAALEAFRGKPSVTADGIKKIIACNIGNPDDVPNALDHDAEAIGLFRSEFLFMDSAELPSEEEQFNAYRKVASALKGAPVIIRTLDTGGDKEVPALDLEKEQNPFLGYRAIRICLNRTDLFLVQLRALLRAARYGDLRIMFPMISSVDELRNAKQVLREASDLLDAEGVDYNPNVKVGIMVEIPVAAVCADVLAQEADFFSIGTNDLIQYSCAVDRINEKISYLYRPLHPGVLRLIAMTAKAAGENGIECGVCGEMAGTPGMASVLCGLGVTNLSMSASAMPAAKADLAAHSYAECRELAQRLLKTASAEDAENIFAEWRGE